MTRLCNGKYKGTSMCDRFHNYLLSECKAGNVGQPELGEEDVALGFERPQTLGAALGEGAQGVRDGGLRVSALSARRSHQQEGPQGLELEARGVAPREEPSRGRRGLRRAPKAQLDGRRKEGGL